MKYFAPYRFDVDEGTLWRGPQQVPLTGKAAALLRCLLASAGAWVSKSAIMSAVWPDTYVQPDNIKVLVREIRQALGDRPQPALFIRSAPGRGYSFIAPVSEQSQQEPAESRADLRPPIFVNRGPELASLVDSLDATRASSRRLVLVVGDHGVGKTALCETFIRAASAAGPVRICYGQCFDRELPHEPYYPFLDALTGLDRRHPGLVPSVLSEAAPSWLAQFPQWLRTPARSGHPVCVLDELCAALDTISHDLPLIMVIEDLQWADADTVAALTKLASSHVSSKLLVVATVCDGEWVAGSRAKQRLTTVAAIGVHSTTLQLGPLTLEHVERYLDARFGPECLSDLAPAVHQATGGNPLIMVNAIDCLVVRRLVVEGANGWRREAALDVIARALPETLGEAIARQLDHLDPPEREALEAAAVVGLEFSASSVAAALQHRIEQVRGLLSVLARRGQLIVPVAASGSRSAAGTYRFRHALCADVIAQRAPMLRQLRIMERVAQARDVTLRRA